MADADQTLSPPAQPVPADDPNQTEIVDQFDTGTSQGDEVTQPSLPAAVPPVAPVPTPPATVAPAASAASGGFDPNVGKPGASAQQAQGAAPPSVTATGGGYASDVRPAGEPQAVAAQPGLPNQG